MSTTFNLFFIHLYLVIGQIFGVMPVNGVKSRLIDELQFKWLSFRTFYSIAIATILAIASLLLIWQALITNIEFKSMGS